MANFTNINTREQFISLISGVQDFSIFTPEEMAAIIYLGRTNTSFNYRYFTNENILTEEQYINFRAAIEAEKQKIVLTALHIDNFYNANKKEIKPAGHNFSPESFKLLTGLKLSILFKKCPKHLA